MSTRETHSRGLGAAVVIAALGGAGASAPALGVPVAFENPAGPGHFVWNTSVGQDYLKITVDAANQPGVAGEAATFRRRDVAAGFQVVGGVSASRLQVVTRNVTGAGASASLLAGINAGTVIPTPTGPDMQGFGTGAYVYYNNSDPGFPNSELPEGVQTYLGVRFDLDAGGPLGFQYGWIGVVRTGGQVDAFAWGYETEVEVPIAAGAGLVPAPGCGALLMGAAALSGRRRR